MCSSSSDNQGADISNLYLHHGRLGSTVQALDAINLQGMCLDYSPFSEVFRKHNDQIFWKVNSTVNAIHHLVEVAKSL